MTTMTRMEAQRRDLIVVSGYYGFNNLGDEAILEELTGELKRLVDPDKIVILSSSPQSTARLYGTRAISRLDIKELAALLCRSRLFISGGGGLFQNTRNLKSVIFYSFQILLARALSCPVAIWAQGIGPLKGAFARALTRLSFAAATSVCVRDEASRSLLAGWQVEALKTADPVWCLAASSLPDNIESRLSALKKTDGFLLGVCLRPSPNFKDRHLKLLVDSLEATLPESSSLLLLCLQRDQDWPVVEAFANLFKRKDVQLTVLPTEDLERPSQWLALFGRLDMVVSMRLHALIMALKMGVPVVGIAYDPKVSHLLTDFEQPILILADEPRAADWEQCLKAAFNDVHELSTRAMRKAEGAKNLACQNFNQLDRILCMQSDS